MTPRPRTILIACTCLAALWSLGATQPERRADGGAGLEPEQRRELGTRRETLRAELAQIDQKLGNERGGWGQRDWRTRQNDPDRPEPFPPELSLEEARELALDCIRSSRPDLAVRLEQAASDRPEVMDRIVRRFGPTLAELRDLRGRNLPMFEARRDEMVATIELMGTVRAMSEARHAGQDDRVNELEGQIKAQLGALVDIQLTQSRLELTSIENQLDRARARIAELESQREKIVEERFERITRMTRLGPRDGGPDRPERFDRPQRRRGGE